MAGRIRSSSSVKSYSDRTVHYETGTYEHGVSPDPGYPKVYLGMSDGSITKTVEDVSTPNYKKLIAQGAIINNPFAVTTVDWTHGPTPVSVIYRDPAGTLCGSTEHPGPVNHYRVFVRRGDFGLGVPLLAPTVAQTNLRNAVISDAVVKAYANIDESEMLALATAAESRKTVDSMLQIYGRLRRILRSTKKLRFKELARELSPKEAANRWMEIRYAIRPLIYDTVGLAESFQKKRGYERRTYRGESSDSLTIQDSMPHIGFTDFTYIDWTRITKMEVSARAGVLCDISIDDITVFGIDQLAQSAWELAPLSFVVDWFTNVGDWIAAHSPKAGVRQRASWVTTKSVLTQTCRGGSGYFDSGTSGHVALSVNVPPCIKERKETSLIRATDPSIATWPSLDMNLDMFKLTDLGIILRNYLK